MHASDLHNLECLSDLKCLDNLTRLRWVYGPVEVRDLLQKSTSTLRLCHCALDLQAPCSCSEPNQAV